jgi:hypothetical protein
MQSIICDRVLHSVASIKQCVIQSSLSVQQSCAHVKVLKVEGAAFGCSTWLSPAGPIVRMHANVTCVDRDVWPSLGPAQYELSLTVYGPAGGTPTGG